MESCASRETRKKRFVSSKDTMRDSCFSTDSLVRIAKTYNRIHPDSPSCIPEEIINAASHKKVKPAERSALVKAVRIAFLDQCSRGLLPHHHDSCILQTNTGSKIAKKLSESERNAPPPPAPKNDLLTSKAWNTFEVNTAMEHIERKYPHFTFLETTPLDFALTDEVGRCAVSELCKFDIRLIVRRGKTAFGVVFNTHTHEKPGGHWICMFCCLLTGRACYYDSYGFMPEKDIADFMRSIASQYSKLYGRDMRLLYNDYPNQKGGIECGTFCIVFLDLMSKYGNIRKVVTMIGDEENVKKMRLQILSPSIKEASY